MNRLKLLKKLIFVGSFILSLSACTVMTPPPKTIADNANYVRYKKAAEAGDVNAELQLAYLYSNGLEVEKDLKKAYEWTEKAAKQGLAKAQYALAVSLHNGEGVKRDYNQSLYWLEQAANQGYEPAKQRLLIANQLAFENLPVKK
jgi:TPR repeat protein